MIFPLDFLYSFPICSSYFPRIFLSFLPFLDPPRPFFTLSVASPHPTMAGIPNSRAMMAAWQVRPPRLVMMAPAFFLGVSFMVLIVPSGYVKLASENNHSELFHEKWWFSMAMLNHQMVTCQWPQRYPLPMDHTFLPIEKNYAQYPGWNFGGLGAQFEKYFLMVPSLVSYKKIGSNQTQKKHVCIKGSLWKWKWRATGFI